MLSKKFLIPECDLSIFLALNGLLKFLREFLLSRTGFFQN